MLLLLFGFACPAQLWGRASHENWYPDLQGFQDGVISAGLFSAHQYCSSVLNFPLLLQYFPPSTSRAISPHPHHNCTSAQTDRQCQVLLPASFPCVFPGHHSCSSALWAAEAKPGHSLGCLPRGRRLHRVTAHPAMCALPWQLELCQPLPSSCSPLLGPNRWTLTGLETSLGLT